MSAPLSQPAARREPPVDRALLSGRQERQDREPQTARRKSPHHAQRPSLPRLRSATAATRLYRKVYAASLTIIHFAQALSYQAPTALTSSKYDDTECKRRTIDDSLP